MRSWLLSLLLLVSLSVLAQSGTQTSVADLPATPQPSSASLTLATRIQNPGSSQSQTAPSNQEQPLINPSTAAISITRSDAERIALKNNPRITASRLLALAAGQVTRETRSGELIHASTRTRAPGVRYRSSSPISVTRAISSRPANCGKELRTKPHSLLSRMSCWQRIRPSTVC